MFEITILQVSVEDHAGKGPICSPLPPQYDPCAAYANLIATSEIGTVKSGVKTAAITTPLLHKTSNNRDFTGNQMEV